MNSVNITGRLVRDPDVRYTNNGAAIARFTLAVDRRYKRADAPSADFPTCVAFGKTGEFIEKYFTKGMKMEVSGRLQTGSYEKEDGTKVYTTDIVAEQVGFAESKAARNDGGAPDPARAMPGDPAFMQIPDGFDDELPFE